MCELCGGHLSVVSQPTWLGFDCDNIRPCIITNKVIELQIYKLGIWCEAPV